MKKKYWKKNNINNIIISKHKYKKSGKNNMSHVLSVMNNIQTHVSNNMNPVVISNIRNEGDRNEIIDHYVNVQMDLTFF